MGNHNYLIDELLCTVSVSVDAGGPCLFGLRHRKRFLGCPWRHVRYFIVLRLSDIAPTFGVIPKNATPQ